MPRPRPEPASPFADGALTVRQVREEFGLSESELYRLFAAGKLTYAERPSGRGRLVSRRALVAYLDSLTVVRGEF